VTLFWGRHEGSRERGPIAMGTSHGGGGGKKREGLHVSRSVAKHQTRMSVKKEELIFAYPLREVHA